MSKFVAALIASTFAVSTAFAASHAGAPMAPASKASAAAAKASAPASKASAPASAAKK